MRSLAPQSFMNGFVRKNYLFKTALSIIVHFRNKHLSSAVICVLVDSEADLPPLMVCATPKSLVFLFVCLFVCLTSCSFHFLEHLWFRDITDLSCVLFLQVPVSMLPPMKWGCDVRENFKIRLSGHKIRRGKFSDASPVLFSKLVLLNKGQY